MSDYTQLGHIFAIIIFWKWIIALSIIILVVFGVIRIFKRSKRQEEAITSKLDEEFLKLNAGHILELMRFYRSASLHATISFFFSLIASAIGVGLVAYLIFQDQSPTAEMVRLQSASSIMCNVIGILFWSNSRRKDKDAKDYFQCLREDSERYQAWLIINNLKDDAHKKKMESYFLQLLAPKNSTKRPNPPRRVSKSKQERGSTTKPLTT